MEIFKLINSRSTNVIISIQFLNVFLFVLLYVINLVDASYFNYQFLSYCLVVSFLFICILSLKIFRLFSAFNLFLFGYFMFQISAVFVSMDTLLQRKLMNYLFVFSVEQINNTILANLIILHSVFLGSLLAQKSSQYQSKYKLIGLNRLQDWGYLIFILFLPLTLFKFYLEIKFVFTQGYYTYYTSSLSIPFLISSSRFFFEIGFFLFLASIPPKDTFLKVAKIYLVVIALFFLIGVRNRVVLSVLFVSWFYYRFYNVRYPKLFTWLLILGLCVGILLGVQMVRQSGYLNIGDDRNILNYFFYSQSTNFYILPLMQYYNLESDIPFVFAPLLNLTTDSYDPQAISNFLGNAVAYNISQIEFAEGHGLGSSFVAEFYELGLVFMCLSSVCLGYFINWYDRNVLVNRCLLVFSFYIISNCIYISRSSFLRNIYMIPIVILVYLIIIKIQYPFKKKEL